MLDGSPIVAIMTGVDKPSANAKTGPIPQVWILRSDVEPTAAARSGDDASVCGDCPLRQVGNPAMGARDGSKGTACYVVLHRAPLSVWRTFTRGGYRPLDSASLARHATIRLGAYGDPAAVPLDVWDRLATVGPRLLGYTHAWRYAPPGYARYCMASVESAADMAHAHASGYRTFRVLSPGDVTGPGEAVCPASEEGGYRRTCATCKACNGRRDTTDTRASITIRSH
jgi:hypothetical protein